MPPKKRVQQNIEEQWDFSQQKELKETQKQLEVDTLLLFHLTFLKPKNYSQFLQQIIHFNWFSSQCPLSNYIVNADHQYISSLRLFSKVKTIPQLFRELTIAFNKRYKGCEYPTMIECFGHLNIQTQQLVNVLQQNPKTDRVKKQPLLSKQIIKEFSKEEKKKRILKRRQSKEEITESKPNPSDYSDSETQNSQSQASLMTQSLQFSQAQFQEVKSFFQPTSFSVDNTSNTYCCLEILRRRQQMIQELDYQQNLAKMLADQCCQKRQELLSIWQQLKLPSRRAFQSVADLDKVVYFLQNQGRVFKQIENENTKQQYFEGIRKTKVAYFINHTRQMCDAIQIKIQSFKDLEAPFFMNFSEGVMRPYQLYGMKFLLACQELNYNSILADDLGLGKSLQTIALLSYLMMKGIYGPHIVVVPSTLLYNWENEFRKWSPAINVKVYYGSKQEREKLRAGWSYESHNSVILTSYNIAVLDCAFLKRKQYFYMILDEAHLIRNSSSKAWYTLLSFQAKHKLLISGTPISNSSSDIWSLLHFVLPKLFNSRSEFLELFSRDIEKMADGELGVNRRVIKQIHQLLRPFMLRRMKNEVESELPKKNEYLVPCPMSRQQIYLYSEFINLDSTKRQVDSMNYLQVVNVLTQLRKICNHPRLLDDQSSKSPLCIFEGVYQYNNLGFKTINNSVFPIQDFDYIKKAVDLQYLNKNVSFIANFLFSDLSEVWNTNLKKQLDRLFDEKPRSVVKFLVDKTQIETSIEESFMINLAFFVDKWLEIIRIDDTNEDESSLPRRDQQFSILQNQIDNDIRFSSKHFPLIQHLSYQVETPIRINQLQISRNTFGVRHYANKLSNFEFYGAAFSAKSLHNFSYINQLNNSNSVYFSKFNKFMNWRQKIEATPEFLLMFGKQHVCRLWNQVVLSNCKSSLILQQQSMKFYPENLHRLLFDVKICLQANVLNPHQLKTYPQFETISVGVAKELFMSLQERIFYTDRTAVSKQFVIDQVLLRAQGLSKDQELEMKGQLIIKLQLQKIYKLVGNICLEKCILSQPFYQDYEPFFISQNQSTHCFLNQMYKNSYFTKQLVYYLFKQPYPNDQFFNSSLLHLLKFKTNYHVMRQNSVPHTQFYVSTINQDIGYYLVQYKQLTQRFSNLKSYGFPIKKNIPISESDSESTDSVEDYQIHAFPQHMTYQQKGVIFEINLADYYQQNIFLATYLKNKQSTKNDYYKTSVKSLNCTVRPKCAKATHLPTDRGLNALVLLHLTVPRLSMHSIVNMHIPTQTLFRNLYCMLPIVAGAGCCCGYDGRSQISQIDSYNSYSYNSHSFLFSKKNSVFQFADESMLYSLQKSFYMNQFEGDLQHSIVNYNDKFWSKNEFFSSNMQLCMLQTADLQDLVQESGKFVILKQLLIKLSKEQQKCLIFTQQTKMLDLLEVFLNSQQHQYFRMDGTTQPKQRQMLVDRFNSNPNIFAFIMTTRTGGIGLNLTGASAVIFVDTDWNPQIHQQATDRVHRINQIKEVSVYTLVSEYTCEENIVRRAVQKKHLNKYILHDGTFVPEFFDKDNKEFYATKVNKRFEEQEKKLDLVYVNIIDQDELKKRMSDVLDAFQDDDDKQARIDLIKEQEGDMVDIQEQDEKVEFAESGRQIIEQMRIFQILQSIPPAYFQFFEQGYNMIPTWQKPLVDDMTIYGFSNEAVNELQENTTLLNLKEQFYFHEIDQGQFKKTVDELLLYSETEMHHDIKQLEQNYQRRRKGTYIDRNVVLGKVWNPGKMPKEDKD